MNEVAICSAYMLVALKYERGIDAPPPLDQHEALCALISSYNAVLPLSADEWSVLPTLVAARLAMSLCIGTYSAAQDPTNEYLRLTLQPGWKALKELRQTPAAELTEALRAAAR